MTKSPSASRGAFDVLRDFCSRTAVYPGLFSVSLVAGMVRCILPLYLPIYTKVIIDGVLLSNAPQVQRMDLFTRESLWLALVILVHMGASYLRFQPVTVAVNRIVRDLRMKLFHHLQRQSLNFFHERPSGGIVSRVIHDIQQAVAGMELFFVIAFQQFMTSAVILVFIFYTDPVTAAIMCVPVPLYVVVATWFKRRIRMTARETTQLLARMQENLTEKINGISVIQAFNREKIEKGMFSGNVRDHQFSNYKHTMLSYNLKVCTEMISIAGQVFVTIYCAYRVYHGTMSIGELSAFVGYSTMLYGPIMNLIVIVSNVETSAASAERVLEYLDHHPDVKDTPGAVPLRLERGHIRFEEVSFTYPKKDPQAVLQGIDLDIKAGQTVALVGSSGAGKSTLVNLIPRFYDIDSGRILIDGQELSGVTLESLRREIGIVSQTPFLFSGTVEENIRYGRVDASDADVRRAAEMAYAHEFIEGLELDYQTLVGERGVGLSGGQIQRIAIARAFLKDPTILILDEATSALDTRSEKMIQKALDELLKGRTSLIIAHRLSTVRDADKILVFQKGRIVESGSHAHLLSLGGHYARMVGQQMRESA